jgi:hypothetical protein
MYASAFGGAGLGLHGVQLELYILAAAVMLLSLAIFYIGFLMQMFLWTVTWILFLLFENTWIHSAQVIKRPSKLLSCRCWHRSYATFQGYLTVCMSKLLWSHGLVCVQQRDRIYRKHRALKP